MKRFKKILCSVLLTSFVILGSVSVFAKGGSEDKGGDKDDCQYNEIRESISTEEARKYKETANADMQLNAGHVWGDDAGDELI